MHLITHIGLPLALVTALTGAISWERRSQPLPDHRLAVVEETPSAIGQDHPVALLAAQEIADASRTIDQMIAAQLAKQGTKPLARTTDEQFVRRAYLELIGRIPTMQESADFVNAKQSDKRHLLIKGLIGSDGYISHQFNWWADLLRATTRLQDRYPGQPYIDWIKQSLRDNKPYDQFVSELIQADGPSLARGNGPTGYYVRDTGMPLDNMSNTIQLFLGTQLTCAQCHNHPNDKWSRKDYYAMAAFTAGTSVAKGYRPEKGEARPDMKEMREVQKQIKDASPEVKNAMRKLSETVGLSVRSNEKSTLPLPHDYQYADAKPGEQIRAMVMFGEAPAIGAKEDPRAVYAKWMTSPSNPRFALVIANRLWQRAMGTGLIEPLDNLKDDTQASNPALMEFLTRLMVSVKFDLRRFQEAIYNTEAWQRQVLKPDTDATYAFQGAQLHRMSAEQLWDSLMALSVEDLDQIKGNNAESLHVLYEQNKDKTPLELFEMAKAMSEKREAGQALRQDFEKLRARMATATPAERPELMAQMKALGEKRKELEAMADPMAAMRPKPGEGKGGKGREGRAGIGALMRASELSSPAPAGHFLRVFGQSDRQLIDNSSEGAAVTQALSLMNGLVESEVLGNRSLLSANLLKATTPEAKVRTLWQAILTRQPTKDELALGLREIGKGDQKSINDLAWALINSNEFLFVQ
jgi:hypothetical protein